MSQEKFPKHEPTGWRNVPASSKPLNKNRVAELLEKEWARFKAQYPESGKHNERASKVLPLGVTSSFQHWDPYPITVVKAKGAYVTHVDGRKSLDLSMGFGAMLVGHLNPTVVKRVKQALKETGTLFVTPSVSSTEGAEIMKRRFGLEMVRFTNSGTESTMYAIRTAKGYTGKDGLIKIEGGYHGGYDPLQVSVKPPLDKIGSEDAPIPYIPDGIDAGEIYVVSYNNLPSLENLLKEKADRIAAIVLEPVIENLSIILPDEGYLKGVRELCDKYGVLLIYDEVKTGLTAGVAGAAKRIGVEPDLIALAKSIGGGLPLAAFGGKAKYMQAVVDGRAAHFGTYNGNPLVMAALEAVDEIATEKALRKAEDLNRYTLGKLDEIIAEFELPAHTVGFGVKGALTWSPNPVRNYRDFKQVDFQVAELNWIWGINRGVITPPGLDEQWLISFAHKKKDMDRLIQKTRNLAKALRS